jgi:type VI secretion system secreted protein VgrG
MPDSTVYFLSISGVSQEPAVLHMEGHEGISQLFQFDVVLAFEEPVALDDAVGKSVTLKIKPDPDGEARYVHGIISRFEFGEPGIKYWTYRATIVPKAWRLLHRANARIFQELDAPTIIKNVLQDAGLASGDDFKVSLTQTYVSREYCVQYRESDWDFVCRLMEEEGIAYYFSQDDSKHLLCLIDDVNSYPPIEAPDTLKFRQATGALGVIEHGTHVTRFIFAQEVRPGKVTLRDYNFKNPALSLESTAAGSSATELEIYDYPGEYAVKADGDVIAKKRLEELRASISSGDGDSTCARFLPGHTFTLSEHPHDSMNAKYLLSRVEHRGSEPRPETQADEEERQTPYMNWFEVIPAKVLFHPPRVTRKPLIHGVQTAKVVGPQNEEIYTDEHGRVKVQFFWDRKGKNDDKSSCWIRVSQPWASAAFGAMFIPRVGDEVVITFLEGDPDRPLIVGGVYHGTNVTPYKLPDDKTKSTIKSHSTPKGEGSNELRFEDKKGSEEIYLHGQRDYAIKIEKDKNQKIGHDETLDVTHNRTKTVSHNQSETIKHDDTTTIGHNRSVTVDKNDTLHVKHFRTTTIGGTETQTVAGGENLSVGIDQKLSVTRKQIVKVGDAQTIEVDGDHKETLKKKATQEIGGDRSVEVKGKSDEKVTGDAKEAYSGKLTVSVTGDYATTVNGKTTITSTQDVTISCADGTAVIKITPSGEISVKGVQLKVEASGPVSVQGAQVDVKATAQANVKGPMVNVSGDGLVKVKGALVMLDGQVMAG